MPMCTRNLRKVWNKMAVDSVSIGKRVRFFRNEKHISQEELAEATGVTQEYIARIETGVRAPSLEMIVQIANVLGTTANDLLSDNLTTIASDTDKQLHDIFSDGNTDERGILLRTLKFLKALLSEFGV